MTFFYFTIKTWKLSQFLHQMKSTKSSFYAFISLILFYLLAYNSFNTFSIKIPFPYESSSPVPQVTEKPRKLVSFSSSSSAAAAAVVMYGAKEESPVANMDTQLTILHKNRNLAVYRHKKRQWRKMLGEILGQETQVKQFTTRVKEFFNAVNSSNSTCEFCFFMTWISSLKSFGNRELLSIESLFKSHPNGCLIIVSNSLDSKQGMNLIRPFTDKGFRVTAISPNFKYLFKNTVAENWIHQLIKGNVVTGSISLGQNLSNLLRLGLLYKFGGIYLDTDVLVLKSFGNLKNAIGAQTIDVVTRNWSRLNNAVMIFDKRHPLLYKFIEEFALTFDGNKWGHNGPYLVSRVVLRVSERPGYNITVMPPMAFYPVNWNKIASYFMRSRDDTHPELLLQRLNQIRRKSFAVHLWNKQSRMLEIEEGSIIQHLVSDCCMFCNSTSSSLSKSSIE